MFSETVPDFFKYCITAHLAVALSLSSLEAGELPAELESLAAAQELVGASYSLGF